MIKELYSFDIIIGYNVIVESLDDGTYQGYIYKRNPRDHIKTHSGATGEGVRGYLIDILDDYIDEE